MRSQEIADLLSAPLEGDGDVEIVAAAAFDKAAKGEIAFIERPAGNSSTNASCLLTAEGIEAPSADAVIRVPNAKLAFAIVAARLHPAKDRPAEIHPTAVIAESADVGEGAFIGAFVCIGERSRIGPGSQLRAGVKIGDDVSVGERCVFDPRVFVEDNCTVGNDVILHAGVVVGTDGFGFVRGLEGYVKFPQLGTVVIEDDVEIGANSCIDRGALGETRIGEGTKIDNLVQIAHNVQIGKRVVIAAQTGISGSTVIEDDCVIGGQVGMGDHARVLSGAVIGSQAGVLPGKIVRPGVWWGTPVQPLDDYKRQNALVKGLGRLKEELKDIKRKLENDDQMGG